MKQLAVDPSIVKAKRLFLAGQYLLRLVLALTLLASKAVLSLALNPSIKLRITLPKSHA